MNDLITVKKLNPSGYSEDASQTNQLLPSSVVGDGGASWRLKVLKRAKEQAAPEGWNLDEVVEEGWGSLGQLAVSVAARTAAPARAHLRAIRDSRERTKNCENVADENIDYFQDASCQHSQMREPKLHDSLSWGKRKAQNRSFLSQFNRHQKNDADGSCLESLSSKINHSSEGGSVRKQGLSANQLAAKVLQLRMKGHHEEAEKILKDSEATNVEQDSKAKTTGRDTIVSYGGWGMPNLQKIREHDADLPSLSIWIDEDDFDGAPTKKRRRKKGREHEHKTQKNIAQHLLTQQERCLYCFENPTKPRHLIISIGNFAYLMLPQWQPLVQDHCCISTGQHEFATRSVDNKTWEEIRNFKKCLILMFAKQDKDVIFLETVMELAQQRRHCLVECIPLPREIAKQAPLFFKKAIDEAEEEWSQHSAKRLIDTSQKGLRGSIPNDFPYFHVEFGLNKGFVHVIDDERKFKSNFGLNVIRGMLRLPEEDMYRRRKVESVETQKQAVSSFAREWEPFDWTKQLN